MRLDYIKYSLDNVIHRKMRSWLTVLSILIGIAAIFTLVSFGQGLASYIDTLSADMGTDKLIMQAKSQSVPGMDSNFFVTEEEIKLLDKVRGIDEALGVYFSVAEVKYEKENLYAFAASMNVGANRELIRELYMIKVAQGRDLKKGDKLKVTLGYNYQFADVIFSKPVKLRDKLLLNGNEVEVVGFYGSYGNPQDDSNVYLTDEGFELLFPDTIGKYQMGLARTAKGFEPSEVAEFAEEKLRKERGQKEEQQDFFIQTFEQAIEAFNSIMMIINVVLILIALISIVVAGVNIANTMYTAVLERTQEIGVMKAIGAKNWDIMTIFLIESGFLGLIGGVLGIGLGYVVAKLGGAIASGAGYSMLQPIFPINLIVGCLLFAFFIGAFAGFFPARQASKLKPVDALRYE